MFVHSLALRLHMPVGTMLAQMSSREVTQWQAYFEVLAERAHADELRSVGRRR